jgi:hypothetical protein
MPTDPGYLTPELNALRIDQLQHESDNLRNKDSLISIKLEDIGKQLTSHIEKIEQLKESRDKIGARVGVAEGAVSDLMGWKKLLLFISGIGSLGLGALIKSLIDSLSNGG